MSWGQDNSPISYISEGNRKCKVDIFVMKFLRSRGDVNRKDRARDEIKFIRHLRSKDNSVDSIVKEMCYGIFFQSIESKISCNIQHIFFY